MSLRCADAACYPEWVTVEDARFHLASRGAAARQMALQESDPPDGEQGRGQSIHLVTQAAAEGETAAAKPKAPEWLDLFPDTRLIEARDGRRWIMESPQAVIDAFVANGADLMVDWDHEAVYGGGFFGGRSPAAGWLKELRINGTYGIQGRVDWTPDGRASVENGDYRYTSPWFQTARPEDEDGDDGESDPNDEGLAHVVRVLNVALVNMPALRMTALTSEQRQRTSNRTKAKAKMDKKALAALGLPETATEAQWLTRIAELSAATPPAAAAGSPDPTQFVPREDFEAANRRLTTAQTELTTAQTELETVRNASRDADITAALDDAQNSGQMPPATRSVWEDFCKQEGGLAKFRAHMASIPKTIATSQSAADAAAGVPPANRPAHELPEAGEFTVSMMTQQDKVAMKNLRLTPERFCAARNRERAYRIDQEAGN